MTENTEPDLQAGRLSVPEGLTTGLYENSAHPPIHVLNRDLTPEEFELVFKANEAEVLVYKLIFNAQKNQDRNAIVRETTLTLYRRQADGRRQVGIRFRGLSIASDTWLSEAPDHAEFFVAAGTDAEQLLQSIAGGGEHDIRYELEDSSDEVGRMPLTRLLHAMEAAKIGRPSTYAVTLRKLLENKRLLDFEPNSGIVSLTAEGVEVGAKLETRCDDLTSVVFATTFERKLNDVAAGRLSAKEFLSWVLSLTHAGDPLAEAARAKLWNSVEELQSEYIKDRTEFGNEGGYISPPKIPSNGVAGS